MIVTHNLDECAGDTTVAQKQPLRISNATPTQLFGVQLLAFVNCVLVSAAWPAATTPRAVIALSQLGSGVPALLINAVLPFLSLYASFYVLGPLVRGLANAWRNSKIAKENARRTVAAQVCTLACLVLNW